MHTLALKNTYTYGTANKEARERIKRLLLIML